MVGRRTDDVAGCLAILDASDLFATGPEGRRSRAAETPEGTPIVAAELPRFAWFWIGLVKLLAEVEQYIFRSELVKSMWIARIARPGAIYDASAAARTFATIEEFRDNESDFEQKKTEVIS